MGKRRVYVFVIIIAAGILIGLFALPGSDVKEPADEAAGKETGKGSLVAADLSNTPGKQAEALYNKAMSTADAREKEALLRKAYNTDPTGLGGGEAAAELAQMWKAAGDTQNARKWFLAARGATVRPETLKRVNRELSGVSRTARPAALRIKTVSYKCQPNDSLWKVARRFNTTIGALRRANGIAGDLIRVDDVLKVPKGPFHVLVTKSTHTLQLLQDGRPVKVYDVGLGDADNDTPTGTFTVRSKLVNPVWYSRQGVIPHGDSRNLLGSRWIGFKGRIGIHGLRKNDEHTIGHNVSNGCIRMRDADVKELYDYCVESKTQVKIVD